MPLILPEPVGKDFTVEMIPQPAQGRTSLHPGSWSGQRGFHARHQKRMDSPVLPADTPSHAEKNVSVMNIWWIHDWSHSSRPNSRNHNGSMRRLDPVNSKEGSSPKGALPKTARTRGRACPASLLHSPVPSPSSFASIAPALLGEAKWGQKAFLTRGKIRRGAGREGGWEGTSERDSLLQAELKIFQKLLEASTHGVRQGTPLISSYSGQSGGSAFSVPPHTDHQVPSVPIFPIRHLSLSPVTYSFIQQIFVEHTLCAKHCLETYGLTAGYCGTKPTPWGTSSVLLSPHCLGPSPECKTDYLEAALSLKQHSLGWGSGSVVCRPSLPGAPPALD